LRSGWETAIRRWRYTKEDVKAFLNGLRDACKAGEVIQVAEETPISSGRYRANPLAKVTNDLAGR